MVLGANVCIGRAAEGIFRLKFAPVAVGSLVFCAVGMTVDENLIIAQYYNSETPRKDYLALSSSSFEIHSSLSVKTTGPLK